MHTVEVKNLTKCYGKTMALHDVSFTLAPHRIYGLLGRNGAGKTTLLSILSNRQFPTSGVALMDEKSMLENDEAQRCIYAMGEAMLYPESMRVNEVFRLSALFYPGFDMPRCKDLAYKFGLNGKKRVKSLSTGYASILKLIVALCCGAALLLLDEPVLGLDANHRELFYSTLLELYATSGVTVVLSTHLIEEVADIVEDVLIIDRGRLLVAGNVQELCERATVVSGSIAAVDAAIAGQNVLSCKTLGAEKAAYVLGTYSATPDGVTLGRMGLQQLFIQLTNASDLKEAYDDETSASI